MKKKILILSGISNYKPTSTGAIANNVYSILKDNYQVDVFYMATQQEHLEQIPNNYYPIIDPIIKSKLRNSTIFRTMVKAIRRIKSHFFYRIQLNWYQKKAMSLVIESKKQYDCVISISSPFITHITARKLMKNFNMKWIAFIIDPLYTSVDCVPLKYRKFEQYVYYSANFCIFTNEIVKTKVSKYSDFIPRYDIFDYQVDFKDIKEEKKNHDTFITIYQGTFYSKIRNPIFMLKLFASMPKNFELHIYSRGKFSRLIQKYAHRYSNIKYFGYINANELSQRLYESSVFINIDNSIPDFMPSKIYEYISYGKPIINIYPKTKNSILDKYPLVLQLSQNTKINRIILDEISNFITETEYKEISKLEIEDIYKANLKINIKNKLESIVFKTLTKE